MQAFLFSVVVLLSGSALVFVSAEKLASANSRQATGAVVTAKTLLWLWLLGMLYAGFAL